VLKLKETTSAIGTHIIGNRRPAQPYGMRQDLA